MDTPAPSLPLAKTATGPDRLIGPAILLNSVMLIASWILTFMTVLQFVWLSREVSLFTGLIELIESGNIVLFLVIALFCVAFPLAKLGVALALWFLQLGDGGRKLLGWMEILGKWSMLDVFVAALMVVALNLSFVTDVVIHAGLYLFTAAVILSMLLVHRITKLAKATSTR